MPISKVEANNVKNSQKLYISEKPNLHKEPSNVDNEKSNAAKYMLGLTALAGIIAVGIIGHKNFSYARNLKHIFFCLVSVNVS